LDDDTKKDKIYEHLARSAMHLAKYYEAIDLYKKERLKEILEGKTPVRYRRVDPKHSMHLTNATRELIEACVLIGPDKVEQELRFWIRTMPEELVSEKMKGSMLNRLDRAEFEAEKLGIKGEEKARFHCKTIVGIADEVYTVDGERPLLSSLLGSLID